jgi:hypothetical protein
MYVFGHSSAFEDLRMKLKSSRNELNNASRDRTILAAKSTDINRLGFEKLQKD